MECIEFKYCLKDGNEVKEVYSSMKEEDRLRGSKVCEAFLDFMISVGFSEENVVRYFSSDE